MPDTPTNTRLLARIVRPQGRMGELLCELYTDFPEQFTSSANLTLHFAHQQWQPIVVEKFWQPLGRNAGRVVLKLQGTDSISAAELLRGATIHLPSEERTPVEESRYYVADLVGCAFHDGNTCLGTVTDVQFPASSPGKQVPDAAALFVVTPENGPDLLIPFVNAFTRSIDLKTRSIHMELPEGLAELNRA